MHSKNIVLAGKPIAEAAKAVIMIHGRGATAEDILSLSDYLDIRDSVLIAPQAENGSWYPYSFLVPQTQNEPWLSSALGLLNNIVDEITAKGISPESMFLLGFSQGACLALEFAARNAKKYGGIIAFTGGLIGHKIQLENYKGNFLNTPVFIGTSDPDPHVPLERVTQTAEILSKMNADVTLKIYKNMGHTINKEEINLANGIINKRME